MEGLYARYEKYDISVIMNEYYPVLPGTFEFIIYIIVNNERHRLIKPYDKLEFKNMANDFLIDLMKEMDSLIENLENKQTTEDNISNNDKPLKCPCCNGNITNRTKCEYCGTLFE